MQVFRSSCSLGRVSWDYPSELGSVTTPDQEAFIPSMMVKGTCVETSHKNRLPGLFLITVWTRMRRTNEKVDVLEESAWEELVACA